MELQCSRRRLSPGLAIILFAVGLFASNARADATATAPVESSTSAPVRSNRPAYIGFTVAGLGVAGGSICGVLAILAKSEFDSAVGVKPLDTAKADDAARRQQAFGLAADIAFGVAFASGLTAIVYLLSSPTQPKIGHTRALITPFVSSTGGGIGAFMRF